jgi:hypothetical protein
LNELPTDRCSTLTLRDVPASTQHEVFKQAVSATTPKKPPHRRALALSLEMFERDVQVGARYHYQRVVSPCPPFLKGVHSQPDSRESRWWGNVCPSTTLYGILQRHLGTICEQATLRGNHQGPPPTQEA